MRFYATNKIHKHLLREKMCFYAITKIHKHLLTYKYNCIVNR